jgi:hypothetical protein
MPFGQQKIGKQPQGSASALLTGTWCANVRLRVRRLASACPVKCEAYFTEAAPWKNL